MRGGIPSLEDVFYEVDSLHRFPGLDVTDDAMPDETIALKLCPLRRDTCAPRPKGPRRIAAEAKNETIGVGEDVWLK